MNKKPFFQPVVKKSGVTEQDIMLTDSLPQNYQPYYYRIIGITPFGDLGKPTPPMLVMGMDKKAPEAPVGLKAENIRNNDVRLQWSKPSQEPDFAGFLVGRSDNLNGPFLPLTLEVLSKNTTSYIDTAAIAWGTNYYVVSAVDTAGNAGNSMPAYVVMVDTLAPRKPLGLQGKIDTTGIVTLHWNLGKEPDLMGYLVYVANAADHTFAPVTPDFVADSTFSDSITLRSLTEKIYYRIVAFDKNRNPSPHSQILELKKPDKIPPVPAVFTGFQVTDTTVVMNWAPSSSVDLASQILYRREKGGEWLEYSKLTKAQNSYVDKKVKKQTWYEYSLVAVDDAGLVSEKSYPLNVRVYDSGVRKKIEGLSAIKSPDGKGIVLLWNYPVSEDCRLVIYRSFNNGGLLAYQSVPVDKASFVDKSIQKGSYAYAIKAVYKDGGESPLTKPVQISFGK
jgi:fibronectin type 3 domain-containing protein